MNLNYSYAKGFTTSKKKKKNHQHVDRDIIGCRTFNDTIVFASPPPPSETPTQVHVESEETPTQVHVESEATVVYEAPSQEVVDVDVIAIKIPEVATTSTTVTATATATATTTTATTTAKTTARSKTTQDSDDEDYDDFTHPPKSKLEQASTWFTKCSTPSPNTRRFGGKGEKKKQKATVFSKRASAITPSPVMKPRRLQKCTRLRMADLHSKNKTDQASMTMYVTPLNTPIKKKKSIASTNKFKSRWPNYGEPWKHALVGDLVMGFASDLEHPEIVENNIHRNYILMGILRSFIDVEWDTGRRDKEDWDGITIQERLNVQWFDGNKLGITMNVKHPRNDQVKVIALARDGDIDNMNTHFKSLVKENFIFERGGWQINSRMYGF